MKKLNERKIKWIIREKKKSELTTKKIAITQNITPRRVKQLWAEYRRTGEIPKLKNPGRKKMKVDNETIQLILGTYDEFKQGAVRLEDIIAKKYSLHIPHNKIHKVLKEHNKAKDEPKKKKQKKWIRYERKHSMSLWHTDWKYIKSAKKWFIAYQDDASRMILSYNKFDRATTENALKVYERAAKRYGDPRAVLTDRGAQFYANETEKREKGISRFEKFLQERNVKHIVSRVNHPQTNGKIERFYGTIERKLNEFKDIHELVIWYNEIRPHMSLNLDNLETPLEAFYRKLYPDQLLGYVANYIFR